MSATMNVWPALGTTVTLASGYVITAAGASAALTDEIRNLLDIGKLLSWDPTHANPNPSPIPPDGSGGSGVGDATVYVIPAGSYGVVGNGVVDDQAALDVLANTTVPVAGGTITFQGNKTFLINSNLSFPASVTVRLLHGAVIKLAAGVTLTINGPIQAPAKQVFDCSAYGSLVLLPGATVLPEWWGAKSDSATDCSRAMFQACLALSNSSGTVHFTSETGYYGMLARVSLRDTTAEYGAPTYQKLQIIGNGWNTRIQHMEDWVISTEYPDGHIGLFNVSGANSTAPLEEFRMSNIRVSGYSINDYCEVIQLGFVTRAYFDRVYLDTCACEGIVSVSPEAANYVSITNCYADSVGRGVQSVAAYNPGAMRLHVTGNFATDCGFAVETAGRCSIVSNNTFQKCVGGRTIMMQSSSLDSEASVCSGNVITDCVAGIEIADPVNSIGKITISDNVLVNVAQGINVGGGGGEGVLLVNNTVTGGFSETGQNGSNAATGAAIVVVAGNSVVRGNVVKRTSGTTTGTTFTDIPQYQLLVAAGSACAVGMDVTIAGVSGTFTIVEQYGFTLAGTYFKICQTADWASPGYTYPSAVVSGAVVTYSHKPFAYGMQVADSASLVEDNVFYGDLANGATFRLEGTGPTLRGNSVLSPGTVPMYVIQGPNSQGGLGGVATSIAAANFSYQNPITYSLLSRSEIWCATDPVGLSWKIGDICWTPSPIAGGTAGKICTTAGTSGTLNDALTATGSSANAFFTANTTNLWLLHVGCWVNIVGVAGPRKVTAISGSTVTLASALGANVTGAALSFYAPTWKTFGAITP